MALSPTRHIFGLFGDKTPYVRLQRAFARYTINLGGEDSAVTSSANQVATHKTADNITITLGKLSAVDIFDTNIYAHDPRADFLNWAIVDSGAYDYAADAWGYTYGVVTEWTLSWWTWRVGAFDLSKVPNDTALESDFSQFEAVTEFEARHNLLPQPGKVKLLLFANRGRMAKYTDAVRLSQLTGMTPDVALVRQYDTRAGAALNIEQGLSPQIGFFARLSMNDGSKEAYEFTEINRSVAMSLAIKGAAWGRPDDTVGISGVVNSISAAARRYFAAGGLGILIGDGQLPRASWEKIAELYYSAAVTRGISLAFDFQHAAAPAYDAARGPVNILGLRLHAEF